MSELEQKLTQLTNSIERLVDVSEKLVKVYPWIDDALGKHHVKQEAKREEHERRQQALFLINKYRPEA